MEKYVPECVVCLGTRSSKTSVRCIKYNGIEFYPPYGSEPEWKPLGSLPFSVQITFPQKYGDDVVVLAPIIIPNSMTKITAFQCWPTNPSAKYLTKAEFHQLLQQISNQYNKTLANGSYQIHWLDDVSDMSTQVAISGDFASMPGSCSPFSRIPNAHHPLGRRILAAYKCAKGNKFYIYENSLIGFVSRVSDDSQEILGVLSSAH
jgi:hypothetical protein